MKRGVLLICMFFICISLTYAANKPVGGHAVFDGNGDYLEISDDNSLDINNNTIITWVKSNSFSGNLQNLYYKRVSHYFNILSEGTVHAQWYGLSPDGELITSSTLNDGEWNMIAVRYNGTDCSIFLNGNEDVSESCSGTVTQNTWNPLIGIGHNGISTVNPYTGSMDELMVYNTALTSNEINQTYQRGLKGLKSNITSGLIAYYDFENATNDEEYNDKSSNSNDCTTNGNIYTTEHIGGYGIFDGDGDYLQVPGSAGIWDFENEGFSIGFWANFNDLSNVQSIIGQYDSSAGERSYTIQVKSAHCSNNELAFTISRTGSSFNGGVLCSNNILSTNNWHFIVATFIPSTHMKIYIDGSDESDNFGFGSLASGIYNSSRDLSIGAGYSNSITPNNAYFNGKIDEIQIYNRSLSISEIQEIYNRSTKKFRSNITNGLVAYYPMDSDWNDHKENNDATASGNLFYTNVPYIPYTIINEPVLTTALSFNINDSTGEMGIETDTGIKKMSFFSEANSIDLSGVSLDVDEKRTVSIGMSGISHSLYINNNNNLGAYACPEATSINEVNGNCAGLVKFSDIECDGLTEKNNLYCLKIDGNYKISGLTGSGIGEACTSSIECDSGLECIDNICQSSSPSGAVPEFSTYALIFCIIITLTGMFLIRKK